MFASRLYSLPADPKTQPAFSFRPATARVVRFWKFGEPRIASEYASNGATGTSKRSSRVLLFAVNTSIPPERALRVLVVAPRAERIERVATANDLKPEQATLRLEQQENERREFHRHHFRVDPDDASAYDLTVNTGTLGMDLASALVVETWKRRFAAGG